MVTVFLNFFHLVFWREHVYSHLSPEDGNKSVCKMCWEYQLVYKVQVPS